MKNILEIFKVQQIDCFKKDESKSKLMLARVITKVLFHRLYLIIFILALVSILQYDNLPYFIYYSLLQLTTLQTIRSFHFMTAFFILFVPLQDYLLNFGKILNFILFIPHAIIPHALIH